MKKIVLSLIAVLVGGFAAMAQLITFDDQGHVNGVSYGNPYSIVNGSETFVFTISGGAPTSHVYRTTESFCSNSGFNHMTAGNNSQTTWTIETLSGNEINLGTINFDNYFTCFAFTYNLSIQGFKNGTPTGTQAFAVNPGFSNVFNSNASFDDVDRIVITATDIANLGIDNINWAPVVPPCTNPTITSVTGPSSVCSGNTAALNITGTLNGATQWAVYTGSCGGTLVGTTTTSSFTTPALSSTTTFFVRGEGGCVTPGACNSVTVNVSTVVVNAASQTNVACNGGATGAASVTAPTGGAAPYTFNWTPGNPTGDGTASVTGLTAGTWTCTVTDANACTATRTFTITQPSALNVTSASQTNVSCFGGANGAASINTPTGGAGGYTYNWTPGNPTGDGTTSVTGLTAGTWTCTVTDANACTATQTFTVTQPSAMTSSISAQTNVSCNGGSNGSATVLAGGGTAPYTYSWAPSGGTAATATGLAAGSYTCTITDANGCTRTQTATIVQPSAMTSSISAQTNVSCNGGSNGSVTVLAGGGTTPYTYSWAPSGGTAATATGLAAGSYTCTITDANGCTRTQTATITQPAAINFTAASQTNVSCFGGSNGAATVNTPVGGAAPYVYNWTPGNPTGDGTTSVTGLTAGTWTCTVTDANACTATQTFTITQPSAIVVTPASQTDVSCFGGSNGAASVNTPTGGAGGYTFDWTPGNPTGDGTASVTGLTAGTWTCTVTDANSCASSRVFTINQPGSAFSSTLSVTSNYNGQNITCNGAADGELMAVGAGGTTPYTYLWSNGATTAVVSGLAAGTYTSWVTDASGCTSTQNITLTQPSAITLTAASQSNASCGLSNGSATVNAASGGTPGYFYDWTPGNPTGDGTTSVTGLAAGSWTCNVMDVNGCTAAQSFTITSTGSPDDASFSYGAAAYCVSAVDPTPTITGLAGGTFSSTAGLAINASTGVIDVSASTPGVYTVTYTTNGPCPNTSNVSVTINALDNASFSYASSAYCGNGIDPTPTITGLSGGSFASSPAGLSINAGSGVIDLSASTAGTYSVSYTTNGTCPNTSSNTLIVNATSTGTDVQVACDTFVWIDGVTYTASNNSATFTLTNAAGCDSVVTLNLTINSSTTGVDVQTACGSYTWIDGVTYTSSNNTAQFTVPNALGCDSLITLDLTILTQVFGSVSAVGCDSYTWAQNGMTYTASGAYTDTLFGGSANGCDSIVTLNLTINNSTTGTDVISACDSYTWINGITYTTSNNSATFILTNAAGCDSVVTLNLSLGLSTTTTEVVTLCDPSYTWSANGTTYTSSGVYSTVLTSSAGCDSTVVLDLSLGGGIDVTVTQAGEMLIASQFVAEYQWIDCATNEPIVGANGQSFSPAVSGSYAVIITDNNCTDTSACVNITVTGLDELTGEKLTIYPNPSAGGDVTFVYDGVINSVQVFDLLGRPVVNTAKLVNNKLDVSELSYGKYIVRISTESSVITKELIIAR